MAKLGRPYEGLVALVATALHPGAVIEVGQWVNGPDGTREIDVSVRGFIDGKQTFILIECKDWKSDVGIAAVDALDSKRLDLVADKAMIFSNSGFTEPALRKAQRKDIMCLSALVEGNEIVRFILCREFVAKKLSIENYSWKLYFKGDAPKDLKLEDLEHQGKRFSAWLRDRSIRLLRDNEFAKIIHHLIIFTSSIEFLRSGSPVYIKGFELHLTCRRFWVTQVIREDVSHGLYDHLKQIVIIPNKELWTLQFDGQKWQEVVLEDEASVSTPSEVTSDIRMVSLNMVLFNPLFGDAQWPAAALDELILKEETVIEPGSSGDPVT
jgi:Restriction endonuclease